MLRQFAAALLLGSSVALAAPTSEPSPADAMTLNVEPPPAPDSIDQKLEDAAARPAGILTYGPVSLIDPVIKQTNKTLGDYGIKLGFAYTAVYQKATGGADAAGGDADLFGDWRFLGAKDDPTRSSLYFAAEYRHDIATGIAPAALDTEIGSLWGTTNGFSEQPVVLKEVYYQQNIQSDKLIVRVGKIDPENYYNSNYWQSDSKYFMNQAFSSFPVRAFPGQGLGWNATAKLSELWYLSGGFQDAQGKKTTAGFDTFFDDFNLFSALEAGYTPTIAGLGKGTYRFTGWYRDAGETDGKPHDAGFDISIDQPWGEHWIPFFRYGIGQGNINGIEQMISTGAGWQGKLLTDTDVVGVGAAWGKPDDHSLDDQFAVETFYRLQVSPDNQLTVGYQVIFSPTFAPDDDVVGVLELRWRITF